MPSSTNSTPPPAITWLCELLSNIRQISISLSSTIDLRSVALHRTNRVLTLTYQSNNLSHIILPAPVDKCSCQPFRLSTSYRLPLSRTYEISASDDDGAIPWSASTIRLNTAFCCRRCGDTVVAVGKVKEWRDLPHENWADLMDFWHCHKPDVDEGGTKYDGLGAVVSEEGIGLVDSMYLMVWRDDVMGVQDKPSSSPNSPNELACSTCSAILGFHDERADGWRLMKWALSARQGASTDLINHPTESWVVAQLLLLVESQGHRRFLIRSGASVLSQLKRNETAASDDTPAIFVWIFNPHTIITTNTCSKPTHATKIYYQDDYKADSKEDVETVYLPTKVFDDFRKTLKERNLSLPEELRIWSGIWRSAWVERFWGEVKVEAL